MRWAAVCVAALVVMGGCAAEAGDTSVDLHQQAEFADGTKLAVSGFEMSSRDSHRPRGPQKVPGNDVTVWVEVQSPGRTVEADDVQLAVFYRDGDRGEVQLVPAESNRAVVGSKRADRIGKKFRVDDLPAVFRAGYLRVVVELPGYSPVTFAGSVP